MPLKAELAERVTGHWKVDLFETPCQAPTSFLFGCCCACCATAMQRQQILQITGEPYICCGGMVPFCCFGEPQDSSCAWVEACCCLGMAVSANRFMIQTRFDKQNTECDNFILWATCLLSWITCVLRTCGFDVPDELELLVDCLNISVTGCMLAQQQVEVDELMRVGWAGPNPAIVSMLKPHQQQMIAQGRPMGGGPLTGAGMAVGAAVGGAAGAAAVGGAFGGTGRPLGVASPQAVMVGASHGFMSTRAPNGQSWGQYCQTQQPIIDPNTGFVVGAWGECLAWAKVFEIQNPGWTADPVYAGDGPCGQVIHAMVAAAPGHARSQVQMGANRLEQACENAAGMQQPLPVINSYA